jgi:hypothetical protein
MFHKEKNNKQYNERKASSVKLHALKQRQDPTLKVGKRAALSMIPNERQLPLTGNNTRPNTKKFRTENAHPNHTLT